jgi:hypothetical protein
MRSSTFINQEIKMYYLGNVDQMACQHISPEVTVKGFKKSCMSNAVVGTDDDLLWNGLEEDGNVRSDCEEDDGTEDGDSDTDC